MNYGKVIGIILCLVINATAQGKMSDAAFEGLKGSVSTVKAQAEFQVKDEAGRISKNLNEPIISSYDRNGNLTEVVNPGDGTKLTYSLIDGFKTYKVEYFDVPGVFSGPMAAPFGSGTGPNPSDPRYAIRLEYKYDSKGLVSEETRYLNTGALVWRTVYERDRQGRPIGFTRYYNNLIRGVGSSVYDEKGNLILATEEILSGKQVNRTIKRFGNYSFDKAGNWIRRTESVITSEDDGLKVISFDRVRTITYYVPLTGNRAK